MFPLFTLLVWLYTFFKERLERIAIKILSAGPIPKHVAFIMDGNRRYARGKHREVIHGHTQGFQTLKHVRYKPDEQPNISVILNKVSLKIAIEGVLGLGY